MGEIGKTAQENKEYLESVLDELLNDETWELPKEARFFLLPGCEIELLFL